ncbi:hypothetical protein [Mycolicibacter virginiensis]|nr:hypothetical protein [Mycolicibacter virginiensis]ULP46804.1 hypothetical protein MJO54_18695 [Mycolicibacter virginiensis]
MGGLSAHWYWEVCIQLWLVPGFAGPAICVDGDDPLRPAGAALAVAA